MMSASSETKTVVVVVVVRVVVVAIGATGVIAIIVPRAAPQHIVGQNHLQLYSNYLVIVEHNGHCEVQLCLNVSHYV